VAKEILDGKKTITMEELVAMFNTVEESDKVYDASWLKDLLYKLREHLLDPRAMSKLRS